MLPLSSIISIIGNDIKITFYKIIDFIKLIFRFISSTICELVLHIFFTIVGLMYKLLSLILGLTTLGFIAGLVLLYFNIKEAFTGVVFKDTKYFSIMIYLFVGHVIVFTICKLLRPLFSE